MKKNKVRFAPRIKNRRPRTSGLHPEVNRKIEAYAARYNCSKSFIISSILAEFFNVKDEGRYDI